MDAVRRLILLVAVVAAAVLAGPGTSARAAGRVAEPPPDVKGLTVSEARAQLTAWNQGVVIQTVPANLPTGVDQSTVVVVSYAWLNPTGAAVVRPQIRLSLGARVPDLAALTPAEADRALTTHGLRLRASPDQPAADWVVTGQRVPAGTLVDFGFTVGATFAAPPPPPVPVALIAGVAGAGLLVLVLLALLVTRAVRRSRRRRRPPEAVEARGYAGEVVGPELAESGPSVSVRLEPHYDAGTFRLEEVSG
jgi:hypothetical protein